jgi:hypothetical protein
MLYFAKNLIDRILLAGLCVVCCWIPSACTSDLSQQTVRGSDRLRISVDPRIELISIIQYISSFRVEGFRLLTDFDFEYKRRVNSHFAPYKNHLAVKMLEELSPKGFLEDAPPALMIRFSDPPELKQKFPLPARLERRFDDKEQMDKFLDLIRTFVRDSGFLEFVKQNQVQNERMIETYYEKIGNHDYISTLESYAGMIQWEPKVGIKIIKDE